MSEVYDSRRLESEGATKFLESTPLDPSKDVYLHDGNIILAAEDTAFRIHESMLQRHSDIFNGMLAVARLPEDSETFDGCSVVRLSDSKQDVTEILRVLYDHGKLDCTNMDQLSSVLRLSTKYCMDQIRASAIEVLSLVFPDNLRQWDRGERADVNICLAVELAHECNVEVLLPAAYYALCGLPTAEVFADHHLSRQLSQAYILGKEALYSHVSELLVRMMTTRYRDHGCQTGCSTTWPVQGWAHKFHLVSSRLDPLWDMQQLLRPDSFPSSCHNCRRQFDKYVRREREAIWDELPTAFRLGTWETLKSG